MVSQQQVKQVLYNLNSCLVGLDAVDHSAHSTGILQHGHIET